MHAGSAIAGFHSVSIAFSHMRRAECEPGLSVPIRVLYMLRRLWLRWLRRRRLLLLLLLLLRRWRRLRWWLLLLLLLRF